MTTLRDSAALIRQVEQSVLDVQYRKQELLRHSEEHAAYALLRTMGDIAREVPYMEGYTPSMLQQHTSFTLAGLSHCLRWVGNCPIPGTAASTGTAARADDLALELLQWGYAYTLLTMNHVAWSNGLIRATADDESKVIEFLAPIDVDYGFFFEQHAADYMSWIRRLDVRPQRETDRLTVKWIDWLGTARESLDRSWAFVASLAEFEAVMRWIGSTMLPELGDDTSLGEYSLGEMRRMFAVLYAESISRTGLEDYFDQRQGGRSDQASLPVQMGRERLVECLANAVDVPLKASEAIVSDLTLKPERFHCSVAETPFYKTRSGQMLYLPRLISEVDPNQMLGAALTSGTGRKAFERIGKLIEQSHLTSLARSFREQGFDVWIEPRLFPRGGTPMTPDLLAFGKSTDEVLVVDFKNMLAPGGISKVCTRMGEVQKALAQLRRYRDMMLRAQSSDPRLTERLSLAKCVRPLLVFRTPMTLPLPVQDNVYMTNADTLSMSLKSQHDSEVGKLFDQLRDARTAYQPPDRVGLTWQEMRVEEWTYRRQVFAV